MEVAGFTCARSSPHRAGKCRKIRTPALVRRLLPSVSMRLLSLVLFLSATLTAQGPRFSGKWLATFKGMTICTLEIEEPGGKIAGVSAACRISVDQNGDLIEAEAPDANQDPQPFLNPKVSGSILTYELIEDDGERMKFEFKLTGDGKAELRFVNVPVAIKSIRFERQ